VTYLVLGGKSFSDWFKIVDDPAVF
jgi:hypothetical protein